MAKLGTLKYRKVQNNNDKSSAYGKWYAQAVQDRQMEFDEFIQHVAEHNSPYSRGTIQGVIADALDCLKELILDGKSVRLSDIGLFSIGMTSEGAPTSAECTAQKVKGVHLLVRNTKTWSNSELRKLCKIEELEKNAVVDEKPEGTTNGSNGSGSDQGGNGSGSGTDSGGSQNQGGSGTQTGENTGGSGTNDGGSGTNGGGGSNPDPEGAGDQ